MEGGESRISPEWRVGKTKASRGEPRVLMGPVGREENRRPRRGPGEGSGRRPGEGVNPKAKPPAREAKAESTGPRQLLRRHRHQPLRGRGRTRSEGRRTCFHLVKSQVQGRLFLQPS